MTRRRPQQPTERPTTHFHSWMELAETVPDEERGYHVHVETDKHGDPVVALYRVGHDNTRPSLRLNINEAAALALDLLGTLTPDEHTETANTQDATTEKP